MKIWRQPCRKIISLHKRRPRKCAAPAGLGKFHQVVTEGAFPVNWIIDKELAAGDGMQISYDRRLGINPTPATE
jgi:hypothetical protein